ncbi:MAG: taurine transporter, periplasmic binding protein [Sporomusa sp.]|jgi:taurine transport system substrate-binding protein|nr:taurine transporter, periplasmic binding protein [Sporomusa sp.]
MSIKKRLQSLLILMLAGTLLLLAGCSNSGDNKQAAAPAGKEALPKEIRIGYQVSPNGELLAKALGLAEKKFPEVKISWLKFDSGRDINTAIASGSIDFGLIGTPPGTAGIAKGLPYQVYYLHDVIGVSEALVVKKDAGINSLQDLKGKKIATAFGSTSHFSLLTALKQQGVNPAEITILDMQMPDLLAAWHRGDIAGGYVWQPTQAQLIAGGGKVIITSKDVADKGGLTGEFGIVYSEFVKQYPHVVKGYIAVLDEAVHYYRDHPQESAKALSKELGLSAEDSLKAMNEIIVLDASQQTEAKYFGTPGQPGEFAKLLKSTADFLVEQKTITSAPDLTVYQKAIRNDLYEGKK